MKKYIKITNKGELDINSLKLIGASAKPETDSPIGRFGSGLNYAIAFLLRENIPFNIYSGTDMIQISTVSKSFRGSNVDVIVINGEETNFTTNMGPHWSPKDVIREIYTNAVDEGDAKYDLIEVEAERHPREGITTVTIIATEENGFLHEFEHKDVRFIFNEKPAFKNSSISIYNKKSRSIYCKGVSVDGGNWALTYNLSDADLTEDRTLKNPGETELKIAEQLTALAEDKEWHPLIKVALSSTNTEERFFPTIAAWDDGYDKMVKLIKSLTLHKDSWGHQILKEIEPERCLDVRNPSEEEVELLKKASGIVGFDDIEEQLKTLKISGKPNNPAVSNSNLNILHTENKSKEIDLKDATIYCLRKKLTINTCYELSHTYKLLNLYADALLELSGDVTHKLDDEALN